MHQSEIVISVRGGVVEGIFCDDPAAQVLLVDWDAEGAPPGEAGVVRLKSRKGQRSVLVAPLPHRPLCDLAGSDIERAVEAAIEQGALAEPAC